MAAEKAFPADALIAEAHRIEAAVASLYTAPTLTAPAPALRRSPRKRPTEIEAAAAAEEEEITCYRVVGQPPTACRRRFKRGKGDPDDPGACGQCGHFAGVPDGAAVGPSAGWVEVAPVGATWDFGE